MDQNESAHPKIVYRPFQITRAEFDAIERRIKESAVLSAESVDIALVTNGRHPNAPVSQPGRNVFVVKLRHGPRIVNEIDSGRGSPAAVSGGAIDDIGINNWPRAHGRVK